MTSLFEIHRDGRSSVEEIVAGVDAADALNTFADSLERRDVAAFWSRDDDDVDCLTAGGERYYARPQIVDSQVQQRRSA